MTKQYREYLRSEEWKQKRAAVFELKGRQCHGCGVGYAIHVHHRTYSNLYSEDLSRDLFPVCQNCHTKIHALQKTDHMSLKAATNKVIGGRKDFVVLNASGRAAWGFKTALR